MCLNGRFCTFRILKIDFTENLNDTKTMKFPHCTVCTLWILRNFCITTFWKISVKTISLVKNLQCNLFDEIIFKWYKNLVNSIVWCILPKFSRENQRGENESIFFSVWCDEVKSQNHTNSKYLLYISWIFCIWIEL